MARPLVRSTKGFAELGESLRQLQGPIAKKVCTRAVAKAAQLVKRATIKNAPELTEEHQLSLSGGESIQVPPGNLKKNIIVKKIKSPLTAEYIVTVRGKAVAHFASRYARLVEFGTVKAPPHPFLRPAFDSKKSDAVDTIRNALDAGISKEVSGLKK